MSSQAFVNQEDGTIRANADGAQVRITVPDRDMTEVRITPPEGWVVVSIIGTPPADGGAIIVRLVRTT
jgi:hypothetical protein